MKPHSVFADPAAGPESDAERAARLLHGMHKVFSHDLPNQMVVLQSLLQLLQMEELDGLSPDGREYVERLSSAARKAGAMVRFLKDMARLSQYQPRLETISLTALARELGAELNQLCPVQSIEYVWNWDVTETRLDYQTFYQAVLSLLQERLEAAGVTRCLVQGSSALTEGGIQLEFRVLPPSALHGRAVAAQRPESVLARELLAAGGAELTLDSTDSERFTILVPG
jgi:signal transduction histidine kinase